MINNYKITLIIAAAGRGTRVKYLNVPKQFYEINGNPVLFYTLLKFHTLDFIDNIIIVTIDEYIDYCRKIVNNYKFYKVSSIVNGGETRQLSVYNGLLNINYKTNIVVVHDAARPFVSKEDIETLLKEVVLSKNHDGELQTAVLASRAKDTIKLADNNDFVIRTVDRSNLWLIQTPQAIPYNILKNAYEFAFKTGFSATDDVSLVENIGQSVKIIPSTSINFKITTYEDILYAKFLLNNNEY